MGLFDTIFSGLEGTKQLTAPESFAGILLAASGISLMKKSVRWSIRSCG